MPDSKRREQAGGSGGVCHGKWQNTKFMKFSGIATDVEEAVAARMEWQKIIYSDREFQVVLEEQALRTRAGSQEGAGSNRGKISVRGDL
ncbi:MAG TPA: Scr1 family TA system antitoxin-like transcriptional regulator [Streptosporangiaceae bacterium]|nr:Scr1 family TA system antitoxin-like transcriptional regulator [Streptosporangiaceae bacterium]